MPNGKQSGPIKLPLSPQDALRALLQVKPPEKPEKAKTKPRKPKKKG
jgi:hypothetical protein